LGVVVSAPFLLSYVSNTSLEYVLGNYGQYSLILLVFAKVIFQYNNLFLLRIFEPLGKIKTTIKYQTIGELFDFAVTVAAIYLTKSIFCTSIAIFASNVLFSVFTLLYVKSNVPFNIPFFRGLSFTKSFWVIRRSFLLTSSFIIEKIYENGLNILIPRLFVTAILPVFTTSRVISNSVYRVSNAAVIPLMPDIQKQFSLANPRFIISRMIAFWKISTFVIVAGVTVVLPLVPYIYNKWTGNKLELNMSIVCYLIMAVSIQNFGMIINEFLKKTNLSKQILVYNIIKAALTVVCLFIFGYMHYSEGLGVALLAGEAISLIYMLIIMRAMFKTELFVPVIIRLLLPVMLFCISLLLYLLFLNYWLFLAINLVILISYRFVATTPNGGTTLQS
jgi:O-antigen/teichoic acid export membrane protein